MKINGVKCAFNQGRLDLEESLENFDKAWAEMYGPAREKFREAVLQTIEETKQYDEPFTKALTSFWERFKSQGKISKSVIVEMCCTSMVGEGKFPMGQMAKVKEMFDGWLETHIGSPEEGDTWMCQKNSRGRDCGVWLRPRRPDIC